MKRSEALEISLLITTLSIIGLLTPSSLYAFSKLTNGFKTITSSYLIPLSDAIAGAALITYVTFSYFKQEDFMRKSIAVLICAGFARGGLELVRQFSQAFS